MSIFNGIISLSILSCTYAYITFGSLPASIVGS
nr:MAG TPA: hypothetical protein [Caudoviricetes sp.]